VNKRFVLIFLFVFLVDFSAYGGSRRTF